MFVGASDEAGDISHCEMLLKCRVWFPPNNFTKILTLIARSYSFQTLEALSWPSFWSDYTFAWHQCSSHCEHFKSSVKASDVAVLSITHKIVGMVKKKLYCCCLIGCISLRSTTLCFFCLFLCLFSTQNSMKLREGTVTYQNVLHNICSCKRPKGQFLVQQVQLGDIYIYVLILKSWNKT